MDWRQSDGVRWLQAELDGAGVAFSTRLGGVSEAPFDSLNLGLLTADDGAAVGENRRRLATALGFEPGQVVYARQVHGTRLIEHPGPFICSFSSTGNKKEQASAPLEASGRGAS